MSFVLIRRIAHTRSIGEWGDLWDNMSDHFVTTIRNPYRRVQPRMWYGSIRRRGVEGARCGYSERGAFFHPSVIHDASWDVARATEVVDDIFFLLFRYHILTTLRALSRELLPYVVETHGSSVGLT